MTLVYSHPRNAGEAVTHAFIVGVSEYQFLPGPGLPPTDRSMGLKKLESPALSAWELACWLAGNGDTLVAPLGSIRLLMSTSPTEAPLLRPAPDVEGWIGGAPDAATIANFQAEAHAWRQDASSNPDDICIFYFGGHGLRQFGATLLLFEDFGQALGPVLGPTCRFPNVMDGMAPDSAIRPDIARTQFYFVDCCSQNLGDFTGLGSQPTNIWDATNGVDNRATPAFMASYPGAVALNQAGRRTDFMDGLLSALESAAEEDDPDTGQWPVRSMTIHNSLERHFKELGTGQYAPATGLNFADVKLRWLPQPPRTRFQLVVRPNQKVASTSIDLERVEGGFRGRFPDPGGGVPHPYAVEAQAGIFKLKATEGGAENEKMRMINQRLRVWPVDMS